MKKNILVTLSFLAAFILMGCGSTSNSGGGASNVAAVPAADMQENRLARSVNGTTFTLSLPFTKKQNSDYRIELSDFKLDVKGCNISSITFSSEQLILDGAQGSKKVLDISGSFSERCTPRGYTLFAKQLIVEVKDNKAESGSVAFPVEYGTPSGGYELMNIPYEMDIREYKRYPIDFQLIYNGNAVVNGDAVEEKEDNTTVVRHLVVTVKAFPDQYGNVASHYGGSTTLPTEQSSQTAEVDADGKGRFLYSPPSVFPNDGTTYDLELVAYDAQTQEIVVTQKMQLRFNLKEGASSGQATTLSIVFGYRPSKDGMTDPSTTSDNPGTGDYHETAEWDQEGSKIINYYAVHAVNEDGNRPIVGVPISMSLINNAKEISSGVKLKTGSGAIKSGDPVQFNDTSVNFLTAGIESRDKLIIIPSEGRTDPSYLGGWNINEVHDHSLDVAGLYTNIKDQGGLSYLIGNERRLLGRNIVTADVQEIDLESITDEYGMAYFKVTYDPELVGHTITLEAHTESDMRVGVSKIVKPVANNSIMEYIGKGSSVENSGVDEKVTMKLYFKVDSTVYRDKTPDSDTAALYPIADLDIDPNSFSTDSAVHCTIDESASDFHVTNEGTVQLVVQTDGNTSLTGGVDKCSPVWTGNEEALGYDYEY